MSYTAYQQNLEHPDPFERSAALEGLLFEADEPVVVQTAAKLLSDTDPGVRENAARILIAMGSEDAASKTLPHIASRNITVRNLAGEVLAQIGAPAIPALLPAVTDADKDVRKFAIDVLAMLPAHHVADDIAARLDDRDGNVVLAAVDALAALRSVEHAGRLRDLYAREPLTRPGIVAAFGAFGSSENLDLLETALGDEDPVVQFAAAEALASQDAPEVLDLLLRKVDEVDPMARPVVLGSIVKICQEQPERADYLPETVKGYLIEMLDDLDPAYVQEAVHGLRFFLDAESLDALLAHTGEDDQVDLEIFKMLAPFPDALSLVVRAAESERMSPETGANFVLGLLAQQVLSEEDLPAVGEFLSAAFEPLDAETKMAALNLCAQLQHPALHPVLQAGLNDLDPMISSFAAELTEEAGLPLAPS